MMRKSQCAFWEEQEDGTASSEAPEQKGTWLFREPEVVAGVGAQKQGGVWPGGRGEGSGLIRREMGNTGDLSRG